MCPVKDLQRDLQFEKKRVPTKEQSRYSNDFFQNSQSLNRLKSAFRNIFNLNSSKESSKKKTSNISIEKGKKTSKAALVSKKALNVTKYPRSLIHKKKGSEGEENISLEDFISTFDFNTSEYESTFKIFENYLPKKIRKAFFNGKLYQKKLDEILKMPPSIRKIELQKFAQELHNIANNLEEGKPLILFGKLAKANKESKIISLIAKALPEEFKIPKDVKNTEEFLDQIKLKLMSEFESQVQSIESLQSMTKELEKIFHSTSKVIDFLPVSWRDPFTNSLKQDIKEILFKRENKENAKTFSENLFNELLENGLTKILKNASTALIDQIYGIVNNQTNNLIDIITSSIPKEAQDILSLYNFHDMDENFWIELQKQKDGKYRLLIYSKETSLHAAKFINGKKGVSIPLVFSGIEKEKLTQAFFTRLLSYEALPKWNKDTKYNFEHFFGDLIEYFEKGPDDVSEETFSEEGKYLSNNEKGLYEIFFKYHLNNKEKTYDSILFEIRKKRFIQFFSKISKDKDNFKNSKILNSLKRARNILANQAHMLAEKKLLTKDDLLEIKDTLDHFNKIIHKEEKKSANISHTLLPKEIQKILSTNLGDMGLTKNHVIALKAALVEIFGKDLETPIDYLISEIEPCLPEEIYVKKKETSIKEVFISKNPLINQLSQVIPKRISLLHLYRSVTSAIGLIYTAVEYVILYNTVLSLLLQFAPILPYVGIISIIITFILKNAPDIENVLKSILPENVLAIIYFVRDFTNELKSFLSKKMFTLFLKILIPKILGKESIQSLTLSLEKFQQKLTKDGKLNFNAPNKKYIKSDVHIKRCSLRNMEKSTRQASISKNNFVFDDALIDYKNLDEKEFKKIIENWLENFKDLLKHENASSKNKSFSEEKAFWYLNEKILSLPIPSKNKSTFWDKIDPDEALYLLHPFILNYFKLNAKKNNLDQNAKIAQFTLHTIVDHLARRDKKAHLTNFKTNPLEIIIWMQNPTKKILNPKTYEKFNEICEYFQIDINRRYSAEELNSLYAKNDFLDLPNADKISRQDTSGTFARIRTSHDIRDDFWKYCDILLKDPEIQKKIQFFYQKDNPTVNEQYFCLLQDPSLEMLIKKTENQSIKTYSRSYSQYKNIIEVINKNKFRRGILPSSFYILRLSNLMLKEVFFSKKNDMALEIKLEDDLDWDTGWKRADKVLSKITDEFHKTTWEFFKNKIVKYNLKYRTTLGNFKFYNPKKKSFQLKSDYFHDLTTNKSGKTPFSFIQLTSYYNPSKNQNDILPKHKEKFMSFFDMIFNYKDNQFMRALGYFQEKYTNLSDPLYRDFFEIFCSNIFAVNLQISDKNSFNIDAIENIIRPTGEFFKKAISYYISINDLNTALYLINLGNRIKNLCEFKYKNSHKHFPNFRNILLKKILPENLYSKDKIYACLLSFYDDLSPNDLSKEEKKQAIMDIARVKYSIDFSISNIETLSHDHLSYFYKSNFLNIKRTIWRFSALIDKTLEEDISIRNEIIENILHDAKIKLPDQYIHGKTNWTGNFPDFHFQLNEIKFKVRLEENKVINKRSTTIKQFMHYLLLYYHFENCIEISKDNFFFPLEDLYVQLSKDKKRYNIFKIINNKKYYLYKISGGNNDETFWIEKTSKKEKTVICLKNGSFSWEKTCVFSKEDNNEYKIEIFDEEEREDKTYKKLDINSFENISLLTWFHPINKWRYIQESDNEENEKIVLDDFDLSFSLKKDHNGHKKAYIDRKFPGFYIASRQKDKNLSAYPQSLILKNNKNEKKVLIPKFSMQTMFLSFSAKYLTNLSSSTLLENLISNFLEEEKNQYYHFDLSKDSLLETEDPEALSYLIAFHIMDGQYQKAKYYLEKIEDFGHLHPFTSEMHKYFDMLTIPLLFLQNEAADEIALRIASIRAKNILLKESENSDSKNIDLSNEIPFFVIEYVLIQAKYSSYISKVQSKKIDPYLTDYQELFLLKSMEKVNQKILKKILMENENHITKFINYFKINSFIARTIMHPNILVRAQQLRKKYPSETFFQRVIENVLAGAVQNVFSNNTTPIRHAISTSMQGFAPTQESTIKKVVQTSLQIIKNPVFSLKSLDLQNVNQLITNTCTLSLKNINELVLRNIPIDIMGITPKNIIRYFPSYCLLASEEPPENFNEIEKELFIKKAKEFKQNLLLCSGKFDKASDALFFILKNIAKMDISPKNLLEKFDKIHQMEKIKTEILEKRNDLLQNTDLKENERRKIQYEYSKKYLKHINKIKEEKENLLNELNNIIKNAKKKIIYRGFFSEHSFLLISKTAINLFKNYCSMKLLKMPLLFPHTYVSKGLTLGMHTYRTYKYLKDLGSVKTTSKKAKSVDIFEENSFEDITKSLDRRDKNIDDQFDALLAKYFDIKPVLKKTDEKTNPLPLPENKSLKEAIKEINQSLADFYKRPTEKKSVITLKKVKTEKEILSDIKKLLNELQKILKKVDIEAANETFLLNIQSHLLNLKNIFEKNDININDSLSITKELLSILQENLENDNKENKKFALKTKDLISEIQKLIEKENLTTEKFLSETKDLLSKLHAKLESEKNEVLKFLKPAKVDYTQKTLEELGQEIHKVDSKKAKLSFNDLLSYFANGNEHELIEKGYVKNKDALNIVLKKVYKILVLQSRLGIFDKIEINEKNIDQLTKNLHRKRVYNFTAKEDEETFPRYEKLLKGKLLFEAGMNVMLWEKPMKALDNLLSKEKLSQVVEAIMGSGKSFFFIPEASYRTANNNQLVFEVWPADVAKENKDSLAKQMKKAFSIQAKSFECSRTTKWTSSKLWALKTSLKESLEKNQPISTTKEDMQSLELLFIEMMLDVEKKFEKKIGWKNQLELMKDILHILRKSGKANIDETHEQFNPKKELNFPIGTKRHINKDYSEIIKDIMLLLSTPEIDELVQTKSKKPKALKEKTYQEKVLPLLAKKVVNLRKLNIPDEHKQKMKAYFMGKSDSIPPFVLKSSNKMRSLFGLTKGVLTIILPKSLDNIAHVNYALSENDEDQFAKPSYGNKNPSETSTIRNPFEALIKTMLMYYRVGLSNKQITSFLRYLQDNAIVYATKYKCSKYETPYTKFFKKLCHNIKMEGIDLFLIPETKISELYKKIEKSNQATLSYVSWIISKEIEYFPYNLTSNPQNFASMFELPFLSYTGTPYNEGCFPTDTEVQYDNGTTGESIDIICKQEKNNPNAIELLNNEDPKVVLQEILERFIKTNPNTSAIIDRGAVFAGINNETIAREILSYATKEKLNIKGVVFYNQKKKLVIIEKGAKSPIPLKLSKLKAKERFSYFDECHTYAADIPQAQNAEGIVTIGEKTTLEGLSQAIWRMRGLKKLSQTLKFLIPQKLAKKITNDNTEICTANDIIKHVAANQQKLLIKLNLEADKQKIFDVIRRAILDKTLSAPNIDKSREIMLEYQKVLLSTFEEDPFKIYGKIDAYISPKKLFESLRNNLYKVIENSKYFTKEEKKEIRSKLYSIGDGKYPEKVHTFKNENNEIQINDPSSDIGQESQIEIDQNEEEEDEQEEEVELQLEQNQVQIQKPLSKIHRPPFCPWPKDFSLTKFKNFELSSLKNGSIFGSIMGVLATPFKKSNEKEDKTLPVPVYSVRQAIENHSFIELKTIANKFSKNLCASSNFLQLHDRFHLRRSVQPFGPDQKPIYEALVIQHENIRKIILIDQQEAHFFKEMLKKEQYVYRRDRDLQICVYDIENNTYVATRRNGFSTPILNSKEFKLEMAQLKFLSGCIKYSQEEIEMLKKWGKNTPYKMERALKKLHTNLKEPSKSVDITIESLFDEIG